MLVCQAFRTTRFKKPLSLVVMEVHAHHYNAIASRMNQMKCFPGDKIVSIPNFSSSFNFLGDTPLCTLAYSRAKPRQLQIRVAS